MATTKITTTMTRRTAPKAKTNKATAKTTTSTTKRTRKQQQDTTTTPVELEPAPELVPETAPQPTPQEIADSVDELIAQQGAKPSAPEPQTTQHPTTRPSTPEPVNEDGAETPMAPTTVRAAHQEPKRIPEANLQKRGRGRPPKSKSSNNDEQPQETPADSIEAAIAITHPEDRSGLPTTIDPRALQPNQGDYFTAGGGVAIPRQLAGPRQRSVRATTLARRREQSREVSVSDDNQLPPPPTISMNMEPNQIVLSSVASYRELHTEQVLDSDYESLLQDFIQSGARIREYESRINQQEGGKVSRQSIISQSTDELAQ